MNEAQKERIGRFVTDTAMSDAVYSALSAFFIKRRNITVDDVQMLAAERVALFLLEDAWRDLQKYGTTEEKKESGGNPGL